MKAWKKYAFLFLAGTMMVSMAACGGEKKEDKADDSAAKVEITSQEDLADLTIGVPVSYTHLLPGKRMY